MPECEAAAEFGPDISMIGQASQGCLHAALCAAVGIAHSCLRLWSAMLNITDGFFSHSPCWRLAPVLQLSNRPAKCTLSPHAAAALQSLQSAQHFIIKLSDPAGACAQAAS